VSFQELLIVLCDGQRNADAKFLPQWGPELTVSGILTGICRLYRRYSGDGRLFAWEQQINTLYRQSPAHNILKSGES
jgi:hypothetical protein